MTASMTVGIDLGSRTTKIVVLADDAIRSAEVFDTKHDPLDGLSRHLDELPDVPTIVTGYGRHLLSERLGYQAITELSACARGAIHVRPDCRLVIDIGGQDAKVISVTEAGGFDDFVMNDRCAAGTGRFLEVMASALGYVLEEFGAEALSAGSAVRINSMCTVFAESEVVSLMTSGEDRRRIALGLHQATVERVAAMLPPGATDRGAVMFVGGVAKNPGVVELLRARLPAQPIIPEQPQIVSALGAALIAQSAGEERS